MNMQSFFLEIAEISLGMSLLIPLMLLVLRFIGRKFTAKCRYILWTLVLLRLTIPFSFGFLPALIEVPVEPMEPINEVQIEVQPDLMVPVPEYIPPQIPQGIAVQPQKPVQSPVVPSVHEIPEAEEQPDEATAEQPTEVTWELILNILTAVYCAGAALYFGWNIVSYIVYVHKILHAGREPSEHVKTVYAAVCSSVRLHRIPRLLLSRDVNSPAAFGIIRRHIILPDIEFTDNALTGTLMHEITHCRRGDLYIKVCTLCARSLHWFNPLVHLAAYRCEMEMELSCDEAVLAGCSDETRTAYGEMMLDIIRHCRQKRGTLTTHFNPKKNAVKARLTNILYGSGKLHGRWLIAVCLILCLAAGTIVACRVEEVNEPDEAAERTEGTEEKEKNDSLFWTYALTDTVSLSYNTDDEGAYILSASDENGEPYPLTEVSGDILQFGNSSTLREVLPLSHRTTEDGYLFYFRYHIQYAYFYEITLIHKEDRLEYSSIRRIEQEEAEELGIISTEMVTVTSLEELADYRDNYIISESVYDFYYNLLSGESEIPEYNTVHIEDYSIRFTVPMTEYSTYFSFTVTESGLDTLPEGTYDWQVSDLREVSVDYSHYDNTEYLDIPEVQKLFAYFLSMYAYNTPTYGADKMPYHAIHQYICDYHGESGAIPRDDFCRIAETEFGITDSTVFDLESWSEPDGRIYSGGIGGGFTGEILDVTENSDEVTVTMQFYSDWNSFLKSHKIAYHFGKNGTWLGYEILDISSREPHGMHFEEETTGTAYTIAIKQLKGRMKQMNGDGTLPAHEYKLHVTGMSVPVTLTMSRDHVTAIEAHGHKVQLQTPLDIYGNCDFDLFEADSAVILEGGVYRIGDIYVLSPEGTGESHPGSEASYYLSLDENGQLKYHLTNNYAAPIIQTGALSAAVGYDEFWYASGDAEIVSGKIVYAPPTVSETISDRYDPDEEFRTLYQGIYGNFNHIDEVFEMNRWSRILERDRPAAADIYRTFLDTVVAPYTEYIGAMEYIDLDGNNIDELILYSRNAGVSSTAEIYTIEDGEVCSFSNSGISVITTGSDAPKALARPSKNANDFRFFGLPSSSENRQMLSFQPCFYGGVPHTILCSYNEHETMKSTVYYSFTRDINNLLEVEPLGTYTMEAVSSDPSPGWNCYVNGQPVTGQQYMDSMKKLWTSIYIRYSVRYTEENTFADFDLLGETTGSASEHLRSDIKDTSDKIPESNLEKFSVLLNMTYEEIQTAGITMTLSHYEGGGSPVYEISGLDEVSVVFPAVTDHTSSANTEAELMAEYPVKILIHGVNIEILPGVKVGMDAETVSASGTEWDEVYMSSENSLYYTTHDDAAEEMPYTADMLCLNQYYRGSKRMEGCDCLYTDEKCDTPHQLKYALYRYTERLTDWKYLDLYYIGSSFVGVTLDENGEYISERLDMDGNVRFTEKGDSQGLHTYSKPKNEIVYDSYNLYTDFNTSNYYYSTSDGIKLTDPLFEEATQVNEGRAIVQYEGKTYHLTLDAWEQTQQEIAALDWCTLTRNTRYDGIIYRGRELDGAIDKVFVPLPNGVWQYRSLTRTVMDKDDNLFSIYVQNTVLDENAESRYPLTSDEYTFMLLAFDDGTDLRRVWRRFVDGSKVYHKNDKGVTTTLQSEAPYMAEMIYKNQYYKGVPNICGCLNGSEVCYSTHRMRYALYKYTERLTDWKYQELFRTEDAFVGVYVDGRNFKTDILDDEGKVIRTEDGDTSLCYPVIPNEIAYDDFLVMQDTETGKYYYAKPDGTPLCKPIFDECTRIAGGSAVVWIDNDIYLLKRKG